MRTIKMKPWRINNLTVENAFNTSKILTYLLMGFPLILLSFLAMSSIETNNAIAAVDIDTSGDGKAARL